LKPALADSVAGRLRWVLWQTIAPRDARTYEIATLTELGRFLELPIRSDSAGIRMRLAFTISTYIQPDTLLLDEGIHAGDAAFLKKAEWRLQACADPAPIVVAASHAEGLVRKMSRTSALMDYGQVVGVRPM